MEHFDLIVQEIGESPWTSLIRDGINLYILTKGIILFGAEFVKRPNDLYIRLFLIVGEKRIEYSISKTFFWLKSGEEIRCWQIYSDKDIVKIFQKAYSYLRNKKSV